MKYLTLLSLTLLSLTFLSCEKEEAENTPPFTIEGITMDNYPRVDGSTSTDPLNRLIACKLLGFDYKWEQSIITNGDWFLRTDIPEDLIKELIKSSQTHNAIINLINNESDLILSARKMSEDEKTYAANTGVNLIETPIALDAFIFIANQNNPVKNLTTKQIQDIYTGKTTNWETVGGRNETIIPFIRNANSGSQELMESLVMSGLDIPKWEEAWGYDLMLPSMSLAFSEVFVNGNGLCYTVYYYKEKIVRDNVIVKTMAVNGVYPDKSTIKKKSYPYVAEVYAVIRSDLDRSSMAYKLYELLQSEAGKNVITESGYIPN